MPKVTTDAGYHGSQGSKKGGFWRAIKLSAYGVMVVGAVATTASIYHYNHPPEQKPHDPAKKTLVVLGCGWGSTSLIQNLNTEEYNVVVVSPRNYFLFTPLLPSCTVGTIEFRSIMQPLRFFTRFKSREVQFIEAECTDIDPFNKTVTIEDKSEIKGLMPTSKLSYDYLVMGVGSETATFNIPGVKENACFLKEIGDAQKIRSRLIDCLETASFPGLPEAELERLLHMVVVGGGPSGIEYAAELHDFLQDDIATWYPHLASKLKITLVEALPKVLNSFHKELVDYTEREFAANKVEILTNTAVKEVSPAEILVRDGVTKQEHVVPYGLLVWAAGNAPRQITKTLMAQLGSEAQNQRRGLVVDEFLSVKGCEGIWALGDNSASSYAPTAQVAAQQGKYLAKQFERLAKLEGEAASMLTSNAPEKSAPSTAVGTLLTDVNVNQTKPSYKSWMAGWWLGRSPNVGNSVSVMRKPTFADLAWREKVPKFSYDHFGSLAYIGNDQAIADLSESYGGIKVGGKLTYLFWRSAYLSNLVSFRNKVSVIADWLKKSIVGRDIGRE